MSLAHKISLARISHGLSWRMRHCMDHCILPLTAFLKTWIRAQLSLPQQPHGLQGSLIVSLTSYPPRYRTLHLTLSSLLTQSVKPDRVILWITEGSEKELPKKVLGLKRKGLEIRLHKSDIGSYNKIIPALLSYPDAFIVTADDDLYYSRYWLKDMVKNWNGNFSQIVCQRAHGIQFDVAGNYLPYCLWDQSISGVRESEIIFPTSGAGVLYPPGSLAGDVTNESRFMALAPKADDVWLYFMARRRGSVFKKVSGHMPHITWEGSQDISLFQENVFMNGNDIKIANVISVYGRDGRA